MSPKNIDFKIIKDDNDNSIGKEKSPHILDEKLHKTDFKKPPQKPKNRIILYISFFLIITVFLSAGFYIYFFNKKFFKNVSNKKIEDFKKNISLEDQNNVQILEINTTTNFSTSSIENSTTSDNLSNFTTNTQQSSQKTTFETNTTSSESYSDNNPYKNLFFTIYDNSSPVNSTFTTSSYTQEKNISKIEEKYEAKSPSKNEPIVNNQKDIPLSQATSTTGEYFYFNFPKIDVNIKELDYETFKKEWLNLLRFQKAAGELYEINFIYENQKLSNNFIKKYFLKPTFIEEKFTEKFFNSLGEYSILFYYSYTRKYPLIVFKIKNDLDILSFMKLWEKESLIKDLDILYINLPKGKPIRKYFITESYEKIDYRIVYFENDYKLIWTIYKDNLIISTSINGFKTLVKNL
jgi:hypothetical protein